MMVLRALGRHGLEPMHGLEIHWADTGRALITYAPALTFQEPFHRLCQQLAAGHQCLFSLRELPATGGTAQPFDVLVFTCPGSMTNMAGVGTIALLTIWIWARKCRIAFLIWRHRYHGGPPLVWNGPKDTDSTYRCIRF